MTTVTPQLTADLVIREKKTIGNQIHELSLWKLPEANGDRWSDHRPRRFELVYRWYDANGNCLGSEVQGATWADFRASQRKGLFEVHNLF